MCCRIYGRGGTLELQIPHSPSPSPTLSPIPHKGIPNTPQLDSVNIKKFPAAARLGREAYKAWFTGLSFSIISSVYSLYRLRERAAAISEKDGEGVVEKKKVAKEAAAVKLQLLSDLCDMTIPTTALGWAGFDDGFVGLAGTTSSLLGLWGQWKKTA